MQQSPNTLEISEFKNISVEDVHNIFISQRGLTLIMGSLALRLSRNIRNRIAGIGSHSSGTQRDLNLDSKSIKVRRLLYKTLRRTRDIVFAPIEILATLTTQGSVLYFDAVK